MLIVDIQTFNTMMDGLIGKKIGMTQLFDEKGQLVPVTVIQAGPCPVIQVRARGDCVSVQLGFGEAKRKNVTRPLLGIFDKAKVPPMKVLKEFHADDGEEIRPGQWVDVSMFQAGEKVDIIGQCKGKGFAGTVKRWGFAGGPKTRGQSDRHRAPGSIGASSFPSRVWKGQKMAGRLGGETVTVKNVQVLKIDPQRNLMVVKGAVPGARNGILFIKRSLH